MLAPVFKFTFCGQYLSLSLSPQVAAEGWMEIQVRLGLQFYSVFKLWNMFLKKLFQLSCLQNLYPDKILVSPAPAGGNTNWFDQFFEVKTSLQ